MGAYLQSGGRASVAFIEAHLRARTPGLYPGSSLSDSARSSLVGGVALYWLGVERHAFFGVLLLAVGAARALGGEIFGTGGTATGIAAAALGGEIMDRRGGSATGIAAAAWGGGIT